VQGRNLVTLPDAPQIRNPAFHRLRGASDYAHMLTVLEANTIGHGIICRTQARGAPSPHLGDGL